MQCKSGYLEYAQIGIVSSGKEQEETKILLNKTTCFIDQNKEEKVVLFCEKKKTWFIEEELDQRDFV